ncbi:MAG: hypothetical protein M3441_20355 [Chloroflexota bacterium]|nr:hypothetical protein [Chloroflexota bacterium]
MKRRALFVLVGVAVLCSIQGARTPPALACSCGKSTPEEAFQRSDAVFSGKVISVKEQKRPGKNGGSYIAHAYTFDVQASWKGVPLSRLTTYRYSDFITAEGWGVTGCTSEGFEVGKTYLVYAWRGGIMSGFSEGRHELSAGLSPCDRTSLLSEAGEDLQALGLGTSPAPPGWLGVPGPFSKINAFGWLGGLFAWLLSLLR